jgi:hypothetical protein
MRALQTEERSIFSMDWRQLAGAMLTVLLAGATSIDRRPLPRAIAETALSRLDAETRSRIQYTPTRNCAKPSGTTLSAVRTLNREAAS